MASRNICPTETERKAPALEPYIGIRGPRLDSRDIRPYAHRRVILLSGSYRPPSVLAEDGGQN